MNYKKSYNIVQKKRTFNARCESDNPRAESEPTIPSTKCDYSEIFWLSERERERENEKYVKLLDFEEIEALYL